MIAARGVSRSPVSAGEAGFALAEVLVALAIVAAMTSSLAALTGLAARAVSAARVRTSAVALAEERMEQLRTLAWRGGQGGVPRVTDTSTDLSVSPARAGGPGLTPSPASALDVNTPGYVDYLAADGRWVGTGLRPPVAAVFIRRWSVRPSAHDPLDSVVFRVLVTTVAREARQPVRTDERRVAADALVSTVKTRRVW